MLKVPLCVAFNQLFALVSDQTCLVSECFSQGEWVMDFKRTLTPNEYESWGMLRDILDDHSIDPEIGHSVIWALEKKGAYSTKFLYRFITNGGVTSRIAGFI